MWFQISACLDIRDLCPSGLLVRPIIIVDVDKLIEKNDDDNTLTTTDRPTGNEKEGNRKGRRNAKRQFRNADEQLSAEEIAASGWPISVGLPEVDLAAQEGIVSRLPALRL